MCIRSLQARLLICKTITGDIKLSPATVRRAIKDLRKVVLIETKQQFRELGVENGLLFKMNSLKNEHSIALLVDFTVASLPNSIIKKLLLFRFFKITMNEIINVWFI